MPGRTRKSGSGALPGLPLTLEGTPCRSRNIVSDRLPKPSGHFAQATVVEAKGRLVFISGITARQGAGRHASWGPAISRRQTRQVCENLKAAVEAAGGTLDDICRVDVYIRNMEHFP